MEGALIALVFAIGVPLLILFLGIAGNNHHRKQADLQYKAEYRRQRRLEDEVDREGRW